MLFSYPSAACSPCLSHRPSSQYFPKLHACCSTPHHTLLLLLPPPFFVFSSPRGIRVIRRVIRLTTTKTGFFSPSVVSSLYIRTLREQGGYYYLCSTSSGVNTLALTCPLSRKFGMLIQFILRNAIRTRLPDFNDKESVDDTAYTLLSNSLYYRAI